MDIAWFSIGWPLPVFIVLILLSIWVMAKIGRAAGMLLLGLTLYSGMVWDAWGDWIPNLFWLAFFAGLAGLIWGLVNGGGRTLAVWGAGISLAVAVLLVNSDIFGTSPTTDQGSTTVTDDSSEEKERRQKDDALQKQITWLDGRVTELESQISDLEAQLPTK